MKRRTLVFLLTIFLIGPFALSADEATLIDFNMLKADVIADPINQGKFLQNTATLMDFASTAGGTYTADQKAQMKSSYAVGQWDVIISSSSYTVLNQSLTRAAEAAVSAQASRFAGQSVLGFRVHFPLADFNGYAIIKPPFPIPSYEPKATVDAQGNVTPAPAAAGGAADPNAKLSRFEGAIDTATGVQTAFGLVKNVGAIKRLGIWVRGLQFPHRLSIILEDENGRDFTYMMGNMKFEGWRQLTWDNPQYVADVKYRDLRMFPIYPRSAPFFKVKSILVQRDGGEDGGDFVGYIKDVKILYDKAIIQFNSDIDDEGVWGIQKAREDYLKSVTNYGPQILLRYQEQLKVEAKTNFTPSTGQGQ